MASEPSSGRPPVAPSQGASPPDDLENDDRLTRAVGHLLRWGMIVAAATTTIGGAILLRAHGGDPPHFGEFAPPVQPFTVRGVMRAAAEGDGGALVLSGVLLLIATPVARVVLLLIGFVRERRWMYVGLSAIVLGALGVSLLQTK